MAGQMKFFSITCHLSGTKIAIEGTAKFLTHCREIWNQDVSILLKNESSWKDTMKYWKNVGKIVGNWIPDKNCKDILVSWFIGK